MNIDHTNLLKALKREDPHDVPDSAKREISKELNDWLKTGGATEK